MISLPSSVLTAVFVLISSEHVELSLIQTNADNKPTKKALAAGNKRKGDEDSASGPENTRWNVFQGTYSPGYADGLSTRFESLEEAQQQCLGMGADYCRAVTCKKGGQCSVRKSFSLSNSASEETTYILEGARAGRSACDLKGGCSVFNDKNIVVFDGQRVSLLEGADVNKEEDLNLVKFIKEAQGEVWLVKSKQISIQARYTANNAKSKGRLAVSSIAIGGHFLNGSRLIIGPLSDKISWDGTEILSGLDSDFHVDGLIAARRSNFSCSVQRLASQGMLADQKKEQSGIDITLPKAVKLTVNRQQDFINVHISMPAPYEGQEGLCGNNNGDANDDALNLIIEKKPSIVSKESILPPKGILSAMYSYLR